MPINQLIYIDCHRLVYIFYAFYFQSRFPKTQSLCASNNDENFNNFTTVIDTSWRTQGAHDFIELSPNGKEQPIYARTIKPAVNYVHFFTLFTSCTFVVTNK